MLPLSFREAVIAHSELRLDGAFSFAQDYEYVVPWSHRRFATNVNSEHLCVCKGDQVTFRK